MSFADVLVLAEVGEVVDFFGRKANHVDSPVRFRMTTVDEFLGGWWVLEACNEPPCGVGAWRVSAVGS